MKNKMRLFFLAVATAIVLPLAAQAADTTFAVTAGSGTTLVATPDGLGNIILHSIPCDHTTPTQCAAINSSGQIAIQAPPSLPLPTGAATSANQTTSNTSLATIASNTAGPYPNGATPITASATGTTAATTATLAANVSLHTYICGFSIRANATAAATADSTVTGTVTGTLHFTQWTAPNASGIGLTEMIFSPCVISSATNTAIAVISAAPGTGGVVSVTAWGFQL